MTRTNARRAVLAVVLAMASDALAQPMPPADPHAGHADPHAGHADPHAGHHDMGAHGGHGAMGQEGSGTSWLPALSPVRGFHLAAAGWHIMLHGDVAIGYDAQGSERGDRQAGSTNWVMGMASHELLGGEVGVRTMMTIEPFTLGEDGSPLLLQTGETLDGERLVDRQHPHDLFMELAGRVRHPIAGPVSIELYGGPVAEPALGPAAFPHRVSAEATPIAPIGHHWLDSTHISFGVATLGVVTPWAKLEGSWFNGREPDEDRLDFDLARFDSWSARLSLAPTPAWTGQVSVGSLDEPEAALEPGVSVRRTTASVSHHLALGDGRYLATTVAWGRNDPSEGRSTDALLGEAALALGPFGTTALRLEAVEKSGEELALPAAQADVIIRAAMIGVGHLYELAPVAGLSPGVGVYLNVGHVGAAAEDAYGTRWPTGVLAFVRLRAAPPPAAAERPRDR
jgi:hypothetical protein